MDTKLVILMRTDLGMSPGKAAAQAGHAGLLWLADHVSKGFTLTHLDQNIKEWLVGSVSGDKWGGMKKIVLSVPNLEAIEGFKTQAKFKKIPVYEVFDEGVNAVTCLAIGPFDGTAIDEVTGSLGLYPPMPPVDFGYGSGNETPPKKSDGAFGYGFMFGLGFGIIGMSCLIIQVLGKVPF